MTIAGGGTGSWSSTRGGGSLISSGAFLLFGLVAVPSSEIRPTLLSFSSFGWFTGQKRPVYLPAREYRRCSYPTISNPVEPARVDDVGAVLGERQPDDQARPGLRWLTGLDLDVMVLHAQRLDRHRLAVLDLAATGEGHRDLRGDRMGNVSPEDLGLGVAPPGLEDRSGEAASGRGVNPARHVKLPGRTGEEDPLAPPDRERRFRLLDVLGVEPEPGPAGFDLLKPLRSRFARLPLQRGEEMEPFVLSLPASLVGQDGQPPRPRLLDTRSPNSR